MTDREAEDGKKFSKLRRVLVRPKSRPQKASAIRSGFRILGPGVITGSADDDPSGIATYSQAGAAYGLGTIWLALFLHPMMHVVQEMCARIGLITGGGLAAVIRNKYSKKTAFPIVGLLLIANTINIGADIGAMAAAARLLVAIPAPILNVMFTAIILGSLVFLSYRRYAKILLWSCLAMFAYIITGFIIGGNVSQLFFATIVPHIEFTPAFAAMFVAIFGTTISPYLFFWQASQVAEESLAKNKITALGLGKSRKITRKEFIHMRIDIGLGMAFSQVIMWFIIMTTAGTLHVNGITNITTADQAAKALEPLVKTFPHSGELAKLVFTMGIVGMGLVAIPVLAGSSAYAMTEAFGFKQGLSKKIYEGKFFYVLIAGSSLIGLGMNFMNIDPIAALIYTAIINGIVDVPMLFIIMRLANDKKILGEWTNGKVFNIIGWSTVTVNAVVLMFATWGH